MSADDIAIVGVGCRFPGADDLDEFWRVLVNGENHVKEIPIERWNHAAFYNEDPNEPGKIYTKRAGLLNRHDEWDNRVFGVSEAEAERMDPQQKHVLECVHMAMEDGGITRSTLHGSNTGVYIGSMNDDHKIQSSSGDHDADSSYSATGMSTSVLAARVSYVYNLLGPCLSLDTACSSALIAIHLGSQAILSGDCDQAICGGVSSILSPDTFMALCSARMMSPTGQCQAFTDAADGYVRGEGCGIVILKKLKQALQDKNSIWAVIKTGTNQDGRMANPMTAPSGHQQIELLKKVYTRYAVDPGLIQYIEAHGTGTSIGDPTEVNSLGTFFSQHHNEDAPPVLIGSVKTNIGHTESAAGVAGLIKVLLMMKNGQIVPSLHVKKDKSNLNPKIKLDEYGFDIALGVTEWNTNDKGERISCVNSFGFGGSNSHAIIIQNKDFASAQKFDKETYTDIANATNELMSPDVEQKSANPIERHLICLSAADKVGLQNTLSGFAEDLKEPNYKLNDIAYTSSCHRDHFTYRVALVAQDKDDLIEKCRKSKDAVETLKPVNKRNLVFVFCGVGTTWTGMCREFMMSQPAFRESIEMIDGHLQKLTQWSIAEKFQNDTDYSDPFLNHIAIFSVQVGLFEVWKSWGVHPDVIVGQSVGEVAAAYASGFLTLKDAVKVIYYRSRALASQTGGAMMVVGNYDTEKMEEVCDMHDRKVTIAVYSSPTSCTLSGDKEVMQLIKAELEEESANKKQKILLKELEVQCAYHSAQVEGCCSSLKSDIGTITGQDKKSQHISTVTSELASEPTFQTAEYWADNVRKPVLFMQSIKKAAEPNKTNVFLEIGPKAVLRAHLPSILDHQTNMTVSSMGYKKECSLIYDSISTLYQMGFNIDWDSFHRNNGSIVPIPRYKFNKSKMLYMSEKQQRYLKGMPTEEGSNQHMFIRSSMSDTANYRMMIDKKSTPYVYDHFLHSTVLVPGATYVEAAFEIGQRISASTAYDVAVSVEFMNPLTPSGDKAYEIELETVKIRDDETLNFTATKDKRTYAEGSIFPRSTPPLTSVELSGIKEICTQELTKIESYRCLGDFGFQYGESLSLIERSWSSGTECLAELRVPDIILGEIKATRMHPAIIDAMFQTFGILSIKGEEDGGDADGIEVGPTLPKGVGSFVLNGPPQKHMYVYAKEIKKSKSGNHYNALLLSENGAVIAEVNDFYTRTIIMSNNEKDQDLVYQMTWSKLKYKKTNNTQNGQGEAIVLGKQRFISRLKNSGPGPNMKLRELKDDMSDTASSFTALSKSGKDSISTVVFASTSSLKNNKDSGRAVLEEAKQSFTALKDLLQTINDAGISPQVVVVTECTQDVPGREPDKLKVPGAELWGLVRSAIREIAYTRLQIIDMDLSIVSLKTLQQVLSDESFSGTEYVIDVGNIFCSKLIRYGREKLDTNQRDLTYDSAELTYLMSSKQQSLESPHYRLANLTKDSIIDHEDGMVQVQPTTICLHDEDIYPVTCSQSDGVQTLWPETNDKGFHMLTLEGTGYLPLLKGNKKNGGSFSDSMKVIFCSPCKAASSISVAKECILKEKWLPFYKPGLITSSVILWSLIEREVEAASVIAVVCDSSSAYLGRLAVEMISSQTGCFGVMLLKDNLMNDITEKNGQLQYVKSVVMLTKLNVAQIRLMLSKMKTIKSLVTPQYLMSRDLHRQIVNVFLCDLSIRVVETDEVLLPASLKKRVPKVVKWLRSLDKDTWLNTETASHIDGFSTRKTKNALMFPYETFSMTTDSQENENCKNNIERSQKRTTQKVPLRVTRSNVFRQNGVYIIVGGLTGLGWELVNLMAEMGAGYLVTFSRRAPDEAKKKAIQDIIFKYDCKIIYMQTDITDFEKLKTTFSEIRSKLGSVPVRGVFQGGGVLADTLLKTMTKDQIEAPMLPKVLGTWNLHMLTKDLDMDFFITHSSIVSIFGNKGQCNYGAGNAFMDSLAHYRRAHGLPGQSINWGALAVGMAVQDKNTEKSLNLQGMMFLNRYDIRTCFLYAVMTDEPQVTFGNFEWAKMAMYGPYPSNLTSMIERESHINKPSSIASGKNRLDLNEFKQLSDEEKQKKMFEVVKDVVGDVFVVEKDALEHETTFVELGVDSMAGMTFVNVMFDRTNVRVPIVTLLSDQATLGTMTEFMLENLNYDSDDATKPEDKATQKFIFGKLPFMQQSLLQEYVQDPDNPYWVRMADLEIKGIRVSIRSWKAILNHVLKINPELRRLYNLDSEEQEFDSYIVPAEDARLELERVSFESLKETLSEEDIRKGHTFDLRTQFPIRFKVATEGDCSIVRLMIHAICTDIASFSMVFQDISVITEKYAKRKRLPEDKPYVDVNAIIQKTLQPKLEELQTYWKDKFSTPDIQPFTLYHRIEKPQASNFVKMEQNVPQSITDLALKFSKVHGITLFQLLISVYQLLLYQTKKQDYVPVGTPIDMRQHAPELRKVFTRCVNVCPLVADFTKDQTVLEFLKTNSMSIQTATQNSAYPYELIQEHMLTDELKNEINRHSLGMDYVSDLNSIKKHDQVTVNVRNIWHTRTKYEFQTAFRYDKKTNKLIFDYGYESKLCGLQFGALIPNRMMKLIERCTEHTDLMISDKSLIVTDDDLGDAIPRVMTSIPGTVSHSLESKTKDKNLQLYVSLTNGSNDDNVKSKDRGVKDESPTEKKRMSLVSYLRRVSKGSLDENNVSMSPENNQQVVNLGTYKKFDDTNNVNMLNEKTKNNETTDIENNKSTVISEKLNGHHTLNGKVNGIQNNGLVNGSHTLNGQVSGIQNNGLVNGSHSNGVNQVVNNPQDSDSKEGETKAIGINNAPVNVLAKRRPSKPDILDYDNINSSTDPTEENDIFKLKAGYFLKQTTHGWDHRVHVTLQQETSAREETSTLYLVWGKTESKNTGRLSLKTVSSTQMMKLNAHYALMFRTAERWYVLKTLDKSLAEDWLETIQTALDETVAVVY